MRTKSLKSAVLAVAAGACLSANANLVINGNFAAGDTGFTSGYVDGTGAQNSLLNGQPTSGAGWYAVGTTPSFYNPNWTFGPNSVPHDPSAQMLIVNGATDGTSTVWQGTLSSALVAGQTYTFSAMVASLYPVSEPTLNFNIGSSTIGSITLTDNAGWETFTETFVAGSGLPAFIDLNAQPNGNDFVVSEISITPVPEPSTIIAGAALLLPFGAATLRTMRKKITA